MSLRSWGFTAKTFPKEKNGWREQQRPDHALFSQLGIFTDPAYHPHFTEIGTQQQRSVYFRAHLSLLSQGMVATPPISALEGALPGHPAREPREGRGGGVLIAEGCPEPNTVTLSVCVCVCVCVTVRHTLREGERPRVLCRVCA